MLASVRHASRPPDVPALLDSLCRQRVRYVLVGSVAALVYGLELQPGDMDIVPELDRTNLVSLVEVLREIEAAPVGPFGSWALLNTGEWKWTARPTTDSELAEWRPNSRDVESLDHLFLTRFGNFDVVPRIAGTYETLRERAVLKSWHRYEVYVAHIDDLLAPLTLPRREKDRNRVASLREIQRQM